MPESRRSGEAPIQKSAAPDRIFLCDRCGTRMVEKSCKVSCPNCGSRFDCSDLSIHYDELKTEQE